MGEFVHLHVRSEYSLLDGACRIKESVKAAKEMGMEALAITDRGVMFGAVSFYRACVDAGLRPIIGCEISLRAPDEEGEGEPFVLLVMNAVGYRNLSMIVTESALNGKGTVPFSLLCAHEEGLIALSGGTRGGIAARLLAGAREDARAQAEKLKRVFGDRFYLEVCDTGREEERGLNAAVFAMGQALGIKVVATGDVCYLAPEDALTRRVLTCIGQGTVLDAMAHEEAEGDMKSPAEMARRFAMHKEAITETAELAKRCTFDFSFGKTKLPRFDPPEGKDPRTYLAELTEAGLKRRLEAGDIVYKDAQDEEAYRMRIRYEQVVIASMGYAPYFLIVADFVGYAKANRIPTGPGRGSGAGSLVAYLIGITEVDPVKYGLLFESFLNPERVSMPDFDIDFCDRRRDEVIAYVTKRYGQDHVCQILTFGTMAARAAVRDVGRALNLPLAQVDAVAKCIPRELKITLDEALKAKELSALYASDAEVRRLIDIARKVEGMPRHVSTHAAGVVITDRPLTEYLPLIKRRDVLLTQYDMDTVALLGLLKFDFLALRYLTVIDDTVQLVQKDLPSFALKDIPLDDGATYDLISSGKTAGLFQLESPGMRQLLTSFRPRVITDIMTAIALFRPGPMDSIDKYLENRGKEGGVLYPLPELAPILDETCGCIVYQEQVMEIFRAIAGYSYGKADVVRRAISKKKGDVIEKERGNFIAGAMERGVEEQVARDLFEDMTDFANYGFKKSHAAAYAMLSYQTAYLKTHFPAYYYASLLTSVLGNLPKMAEYIAESTRLGIAVLPPDVNESGAGFEVQQGAIRFGLLGIKNVGVNLIARILEERKNGRFERFYDFLRRNTGSEMNKRAMEALIHAGALDGMDVNRAQMLHSYDALIDQFSSRGGLRGQMDLFGTEQVGFAYPALPDLTVREKLRLEKEVCGINCSGHLLDDYTAHLDALAPISLSALRSDVGEGTWNGGDFVVVCGILVSRTDKVTKNGDDMAFAMLEDRAGGVELVIFPKVLPTVEPYLVTDMAIAASGRLDVREDGGCKVLVDRMVPLIPNARFHPETYRSPFAQEKGGARPSVSPAPMYAPPGQRRLPVQGDGSSGASGASMSAARPAGSASAAEAAPRQGGTVYLRVSDMEGAAMKKACNLCEIFEGSTAVIFFDEKKRKYIRAVHLSLYASDFVLRELEGILGEGNVVYKG